MYHDRDSLAGRRHRRRVNGLGDRCSRTRSPCPELTTYGKAKSQTYQDYDGDDR